MLETILVALAAMSASGISAPHYDSFSHARKLHYITIDANGDDHQTLPQAINAGGQISGDIITEKVSSAFKRDVHGDMLEYGVLGGGQKAGQGAFAVSISGPNGDIGGYMIDQNGHYHGFIQRQDDDYDIQIDIPGGKNTKLTCLGPTGTAVGTIALKGVTDGFYRDYLGNISMFFVAGASKTIPLSINTHDLTAGIYLSNGIHSGFLRTHAGRVGTFQVLDQTDDPQDIHSLKINAKDSIAGTYADGAGALHGFLRSQYSQSVTFDVAGAGSASGQGTVATDINDNGDVVGYFVTGGGVAHGFLRTVQGGVTTFDVPGASDTYATALNGKGDIVGYFSDSKHKRHGFLRKP